jgi:hypothetical protein
MILLRSGIMNEQDFVSENEDYGTNDSLAGSLA